MICIFKTEIGDAIYECRLGGENLIPLVLSEHENGQFLKPPKEFYTSVGFLVAHIFILYGERNKSKISRQKGLVSYFGKVLPPRYSDEQNRWNLEANEANEKVNVNFNMTPIFYVCRQR